jgi:hypothetical protein
MSRTRKTDNQIIDELLNLDGLPEVPEKKAPETFIDVDLFMKLKRAGRSVHDLAGIFYITVDKAKEIAEYYENI